MCRWKLFTFDVTNTLLKVQGTAGQQYSRVASRYGVHIPARDIDAAYQKVWPEQWSVHPNYGSHTGLSQRQWWRQFVNKVFMEAKYDGDQETLHRVSSQLYQEFESGNLWDVMPGTHDMLRALKNRGVSLAVVSNFDERLAPTLEQYDLKDYFEFLLTSTESGYDKPDRRIFEAALHIAGVSAHESIHIGDSLDNDYLAARNVGMDALLLVDEPCDDLPASVVPQDVITSLSQIDDIVERDVASHVA